VAGRNAQKLEDFFQEQCLRSSDEDFAQMLRKNLGDKISSFSVDSYGYFSQEAGNTYIVRALLFAIDKTLRGGANPLAMNPSAIHVEHIAPQKPTDHWLTHLGFSGDPESYATVINLPGNLTLLDQRLNLQAQQKAYSEKSSGEYPKSNVHVTRDLAEVPDWSVQMINDRTRWLAEQFDFLFSLSDADSKFVVHFHEWLANKT
jgi:hypothetical protein